MSGLEQDTVELQGADMQDTATPKAGSNQVDNLSYYRSLSSKRLVKMKDPKATVVLKEGQTKR